MHYLFFYISFIAVWVVMSISANIVVGYGGLLSLGHVAFMAMGAYTTGVLMLLLNQSFWVAALAGMAVAGLGSLVVIVPLLRLPTFYFGLATLAFNFIVSDALNNVGPTVARTSGLFGFPLPSYLSGDVNVMVFCLVLAGLVTLLWSRLVGTKFGLQLRCARDDELAAGSVGIDATRVRLMAWVLSGVLAGLAGAMFLVTNTYLDATEFTYDYSIFLLIYLGVGGLGSVWGSIVGPVLLLGVVEGLQQVGFSGSWAGPLQESLYALVLIVVFIWRPRGLLGQYDYRG